MVLFLRHRLGEVQLGDSMDTYDWTCPFCNRGATITTESVHESTTIMTLRNAEGAQALESSFIVCPNSKCKRFSLSVSLLSASQNEHNRWEARKLIQTWQLIPSSQAQSFPAYIPKVILDDYSEACLICDLSPKASATLSRRCMQGIIRDFWRVKPGRLVDEIAQIKDKVDSLTWDAIEAVRKVGNIGAHMEADINLIVDVEPNEAKLLIGLNEMLLKEWYIARESKKTRLSSLVQLAGKKDDVKKQNKT